MTKSYSIRDDGQPAGKIWSKGGSGSPWSKNRKVWGNLGPFKNHINLFNPIDISSYRPPDLSNGFYEGTLISRRSGFPYGGDQCVVIEVDEVANTIKEYPAAKWCWNNVFFPWYQKQWESKQDSIRRELGVKGEIMLSMLEPINVEAVHQVEAFDPLTDDEIYELLEGVGAENPVELVRATEALVRERIIKQKAQM